MKKTTWKVQDLTLCALFTALTAIGAFIQINIPVEPIPMHFTLQFFFALLAGFLLGGKLGSWNLSDDRTLWCSDLRIRWRTILPVKTNFWIFARIFLCCRCCWNADRPICPEAVSHLLFYFHGRALCDVLIRQPLFLLCQQLHRTHHRIVENCSDQLLPFNCSRRFCPVCAISNCCAAADHYYEKNFTLNPFRLRYHSSAFSP